MKLSLEIIYKSNQSTKKSGLGFWIDGVTLLKEKHKLFYSNVRQGV